MMEPVAHIVIKPDGKRSVTLATKYDPMASAFWLGGERPEGYSVEPLIRLSDAEARIAELEAELETLRGWVDPSVMELTSIKALTARAEAAEALLSRLLSYVPEECFEGEDRWELVKCNRSGGAWFGAEDFRAARAIHDKIGGGE